MSTQKFLAKNSLMVAMVLAGSSILGVIRESAIAYQFGATGVTDAYLIAMIIPTLFINLIRGSITNTFITVFGGRLAQGEKEAGWRMANIVISLLSMGICVLLAVFFLFTEELVSLLAPTYTGEQLRLATNMTRILLPSILLGGVMGILVGINNVFHSFFIPSVIWPLSNVIVILSIFLLGPSIGIYGLAIGTLIGAVAQFLIQIPTARKHGWHYSFSLDWKDSGVRETMWLVTPFILSAAASQVNLIIDRILATSLPQGVVSALYFANKLVFLPQNIFTAALGMVVFPLLVQSASKQDWPGVVEGVYRAVRILTIILLPAIAGIYVLRYPLVRLLFEQGAFTARDTQITVETLPYFFGALFFGGMVIILVNIYFATKKMVVAVGTGIISLGVNIGLSLWLIAPLKQRGLALANSLSAFVNLLLLTLGLFVILRLHEKTKLPWKESLIFFGQIALAVMGMAGMVWGYRELVGVSVQLGSPLPTLGAVLFGFLFYLGFLWLLHVKEVRDGIRILRSSLVNKFLG